jgi:hypothetical protein
MLLLTVMQQGRPQECLSVRPLHGQCLEAHCAMIGVTHAGRHAHISMQNSKVWPEDECMHMHAGQQGLGRANSGLEAVGART